MEAGRLIPVEIKSASTFFTPDFLKGIKKLRSIGPKEVSFGVVLYNGKKEFQVKGVRIFNPLSEGDLWSSVVNG